jgi:hypothetical protein
MLRWRAHTVGLFGRVHRARRSHRRWGLGEREIGRGSHPQLLEYDGDRALDIATRTPDGVGLLRALGGGAFEERDFGVDSWDMEDFEITLATDERPAELHALYRLYRYEPCAESCARCVFGAWASQVS